MKSPEKNIHRERESEKRKKEVYNGQEEWMSKWELWIFREKQNKRGGPDKKIGNYKLNIIT